MNGFDVYKTYLGIKSHFKNPTYDYSKYGNVKAKLDTFLSRSDRHFFERISKKYNKQQIIDMFVANFLANENVWIGDFLTTELESIYSDWRKRQESIEYTFEQDVYKICDILENHNKKFDDLFVCNNGHPKIFCLVLQKEISPETYVILENLLKFNKDFDAQLKHDPAYNSMALRYKKYATFVDLQGKQKNYRKKLVEAINRYAVA